MGGPPIAMAIRFFRLEDITMALRLLLALLIAPMSAVDSTPAPAAQLVADATATVPSYPNASCPIMGKPISQRLYADTEFGRIWVCCKGCIADIQADVALAYTTAYPSERTVESKVCPITGKPLVESSPEVLLQGLRFRVLDAAAAKRAVAESQITLARLLDPKLVDLGNAICPIDGEPTAPNAFVVIDGRIVRLSSPKHVEAAQKAPGETLARALEIAAAQERS